MNEFMHTRTLCYKSVCVIRGYSKTTLKSCLSMYRDNKYITLYKAPHTKIYSVNFIDFVV